MKLKTTKREQAAQLVATDKQTDDQIAQSLGVTRRTLARWKLNKAFLARVDELAGIWADRALKHDLARRERRLEVLQDMHNRLLAIIGERGAAPDMQDVPGGKTGLICRTLKGIGKGDDFRVVEEFTADTVITKEIRCIQESIAKELGQFIDRSKVEVTVGLADAVSEARKRVMGVLEDLPAVVEGSETVH